MDDSVHVDHTNSSDTLYFRIRNKDDKVWWPKQDGTGNEFETYGTGSRDSDDYDRSLTHKGGCRYSGKFEQGNDVIPIGIYSVQVCKQAGGSPADNDSIVGSEQGYWTGVAWITFEQVVMNKAVQNKTTRVIQYYDDDGSEVILTHTPSEDAVNLTRTPS